MSDAPGDLVSLQISDRSRADELLLTFLRDFDAQCPVCGYNLRALTRPICPECGQTLVLTVGTTRLRLRWFLAAVAPGFFSGIAAIFLLIPIIGRLVAGDGRMSPALNALDGFGLCSGLFAIGLAVKRHRFLAMPIGRQRWVVAAIWLVHLGALALIILIPFGFF